MEESEKMVALKKAYAEIILNTAKEAAARVMASERKAHEYCHDLASTKEEALRLLLRLKQTMDAKIIEVEMKSQDQQKKIEVLEAQLQEAEDIVSSLRDELNDAHVKLYRLANNRLHNGSNTVDKDDNMTGNSQPENRLTESVLASQAAKINNGVHGLSSANNSLDGFGCSGELEIPSIISRRKESERHLSKCTQRIHKCNGDLSKDHPPLAKESDDLKDVKTLREDNEGQISRVTNMKTPIADDNNFIEEEEPVIIKEADDEEPVNIMQALKSLIKRRKYKRNSASPSKLVSDVAEETCCDLSTSHASLRGSHDMRENGGEDKVTQSSSPCTTPFDVSEDVNGDREVASSVTAQQSTFGDSVDALGPNTEPEMKGADSLNLDVKLLETSDELASPPSKARVLKYTFQRKRKRDSVVNDDNSHLDEENPREKMTKKQNGNLEPVKSSDVTESLRDGRGMTQVARMLSGTRPPSVGALDAHTEKKLASSDSKYSKSKRLTALNCGVIWRKKASDDGSDFRLKNIIFRGSSDGLILSPQCLLCHKPYNSHLMYIRCDTCEKWYHADAVKVDESKLSELIGFKCCHCRRIRSPSCPFSDLIIKKPEVKKLWIKGPKGERVEATSVSEALSEPVESLPSTPMSMMEMDEDVFIEVDDPLAMSAPPIEQMREPKPEVDCEWNAFGPGPQKLPV